MCCTVLLLVTAGMRSQNTLRPAAKRDASSHAMTQVINQIEPLCREFFPGYDTLRFLAVPSPVFHKSGAPRNLWAVCCFDAQGNHLLHALWDEDRKRPVQIGRSQSSARYFISDSHTPAPRISDRQALATAREWAARLHLAKSEEVQSSRNLLRCFTDILSVNFYLPSRSIRVSMMADSGEVQGAYISEDVEPFVPPTAVETSAAHA